MPSKSKPLTKAELAAYEAKRDLAAELLQSVRDMKAGQVHVVTSPVIEACKKTGLSQSQFAALLGVSVRTRRVFAEGKEAGRAVYDSLPGGANMSKFIRTEPRLTELVAQLFTAPVTR